MYLVEIPKVDRDERIGSVFNGLFKVINATESASSKSVVWDFKGTSFFHPFFLAPLAIYKERVGVKVSCYNISDYLGRYFNLIHFGDILNVGANDDLKAMLLPYINKTYTPICKFSLKDEYCADNVQSVIQSIIKQQSNYEEKVHTPLAYMLGELVCNMSQHSRSEYGYMYSQMSKRDKCINLCLADNGITVYGSFVSSERYKENITGEADALKLANEGHSTKGGDKRGFGIISSRQLLVDGMKGSFFMLSGGAFYRYENGVENYVELPKSIFWNGTVVLLRIPTRVGKDFNFYNYVN